VEKFGIDPDRVRGMESEDLAWLRAGEGEGHFHGPGAWPFGINAYAGREDNDLILWLPSINAIVSGDSLSDFGDGLDIQLGGRKHVTRDDVVQRLRPLLDLPVELVLPAHGQPADRAALERVFPERRRRGSCGRLQQLRRLARMSLERQSGIKTTRTLRPAGSRACGRSRSTARCGRSGTRA
jgi:hypothetical protein